VLNMKDPSDVATMRAVAEETFALVREYKGSHSGEHGDGLARSEFHEQMFGPRIVRAFETVKHAFDPIGLLNPNRITHPPRMDDRTLFRYSPGYGPISDFTPKLDWSDHPGPIAGMLGAVEMCNNNGTCRGFDSGVMCPSYRVTRDETHLTRGRANTLRLALTGQLGADAMTSEAMTDAMALCVSCKACKRECPTGVDMAKMKIEVTAARAERYGVKWRETLIAELPRYAPFVSHMPTLANLRNYVPPLRWLGERILGFSAARRLPKWRRDKFLDKEAAAATPASPAQDVYLLADTFNRYFEPENLRAALKVLAAAGFRAIVAETDGRPLCCGRTWLAVGMVDKAREEAARTMRHMPRDLPIIGLEPSCLMTLRDEFKSLLPGALTNRFAERAMLLSEFIIKEKPRLALRALPGIARVHGHCHQKAFGAFPDALAMLRLIPRLSAQPIVSSCCGMAGTFGYQVETEATSRTMAEAGLLPAVRAAAAHDYIIADGTSCRHQIRDLSGREAIHSVRLMERALESAP
jgi:Fe-S oxidoreductase